jgi:hypothetical protein
MRTLLAMACAWTLTACELLTPTPAHDPVAVSCASFAIIHEDPKTDTLETIAQIRKHNAAWHALCDKWGGTLWGQPK